MTRGERDSLPDPPDAPDIPRSISLYRFQWPALAVIIALPLLALFGVFGERSSDVSAAHGSLDVAVRYPAVTRYRMQHAIDLHVRNRGDAVLDAVTISVDTAYAARFSAVTSVPSFSAAFTVELTDVQPSERRRVRIELQAEAYGSHSGTLTIASRTDTVRVPLATMIYP